MARTIHNLSDRAIKAAKPGVVADGGGLYLRVKASGSKSWSFRWKRGGKVSPSGNVIPNEIGLGPYPAVSLADARLKAAAYRELVASGGNPKAEKAKSSEPTFGECVEMFLETMQGQWSNEKHRGQWRMTLTERCNAIKDMQVSKIDRLDVLNVLQPCFPLAFMRQNCEFA